MLLTGSVFLACSNDDSPEIKQKDWGNTSEYFASTDAPSYSIYYKPQVGYVGDPMPFFDPKSKEFKIMYLQEFRPNSLTYHPYWALSTADGGAYTQLGELIPTGTIQELDAALGTGCTVYNETDGTYYTFYTGHSYNPAYAGGLREGVMLATSKDFKNWQKERWFLISPAGEYSTDEFRDPCVFKGDDGLFHMVVSTKKDGKGTLAEYTSSDLRNWDSAGTFMTMMWDRFYECPDVFKMGDWWYLIYSEQHSAIRKVQYFKGRTLDDLKACTRDDAGIWPDNHEGFLDSRAFYAGKTATDGTNRYIWGWCPTRAGQDNTNVGGAEPEWAGALVAHKVIQHADGTLALGPVDGILNKISSAVEVKVMEKEGDVTIADGSYTLSGYSHLLFNRLAYENNIEFTVTTEGPNDKFGVSFVRGSDSDKFYSLIVNPEGEGRRKINFEQEGTEGIGFIGNADGYVFDAPDDGVYRIRIVTDNSVCTLYINDVACQTSRIYGIQKNCWSINSYDGTIRISDLKVRVKG